MIVLFVVLNLSKILLCCYNAEFSNLTPFPPAIEHLLPAELSVPGRDD